MTYRGQANPFGIESKKHLGAWLEEHKRGDTEVIWGVTSIGIQHMLQVLRTETRLPWNPHTFRRTFASILAKRGVDSLHIMRLGRWESISMVERYTRSIKFEDSLKLYQSILS